MFDDEDSCDDNCYDIGNEESLMGMLMIRIMMMMMMRVFITGCPLMTRLLAVPHMLVL